MSRHRFHGDPARFEVVADFIAERYWKNVKYIADVAGGQGMLARILTKKYNYSCDVIDPRGWVLKGVSNRQIEYTSSHAQYYDLVVGLHCDEALRPVAESALVRPVILVPCCNFWSEDTLGQWELIAAIENYYQEHGVNYEKLTLPFRGPKNTALISSPSQR